MAQVVKMPKLGFDMAEGTLIRWVVLEGESLGKGDVLAEIETDKATVEVESPYAGVIARHLVQAGDIVPVSTPIAVVGEPGEEIDYEALAELKPAEEGEEKPAAIEPPVEEPQAPRPGAAEAFPGGIKASPLARRMAEEHNLSLQAITGSGPGGRVVKKDIEAFLAQVQATPQVAPAAGVPMLTPFAPAGAPPPDQLVPLSKLRATIGRRMVAAKQAVPHFYVTHEIDMSAAMSLRKQVNQLLPVENKTSVNDYIVKAVALALREFPNLNASLDGDKVIHHGQVNVGVAVAVEGGLLTVVCRDADRKPLRALSADIRSMVARAREGKVRLADIEGSTFSVSNLGMFDVEHFIAIINPPEAAILALGSIREVPVIQDGEIVPGMRMKATISVDHRVSDGAEAARFMQALDRYLMEPLTLLL